MNGGRGRLTLIAALFAAMTLLLPLGSPASADTKEQQTKARIAELKREIERVQRRMIERSSERDALQEQLRAAEIEMGELDQSLADVEAAIAAELPRLAALDEQRSELREHVSAQQRTMNTEMKNLWALQQGGGLRILFGDQSPDRLARNLGFYKRLLTARQDSIVRFKALLEQVAENAAAIQASQQRLAAQRATLEEQRSRVTTLQRERRDTLAAIKKALGTDAQKKAKLEGDAQQLTLLLEELRKTLAELDTPSSYRPFSEVKGRMPPPVKGRPANRYGDQRNAGDMRWRGWIIPAREGSEVKAIHHGRVVYADWLRGQGLLLIIDHGEGYLSLYGHNRSLQRDVGDWVRPGDVIATVGASGGLESPGVYFEIRHKGEPINPGRWIGG